MKPEYESPTIEIFSFATNEIMDVTCPCETGFDPGVCTCENYCVLEVS